MTSISGHEVERSRSQSRDFLDESGPVGFRLTRQRGLVEVQGGGGLGTLPGIPLPPSPVTVPAVVTHEVFALVGDMGEQQFEPLGGGQELEVALEGGVEFGTIDDHTGPVVIGHFLQGEGCADHIAGELLSAFGIVGVHPDLVGKTVLQRVYRVNNEPH